MVQLRILAGAKAGQVFTAGHFPICIGRAHSADLLLEDDGVWDQHLRISLQPDDGVILALQSGAYGALNGQGFQTSVLRNGDMIEIGGAKLQFWLSEARPRSQSCREKLTWFFLVLLGLIQVALVYWLAW